MGSNSRLHVCGLVIFLAGVLAVAPHNEACAHEDQPRYFHWIGFGSLPTQMEDIVEHIHVEAWSRGLIKYPPKIERQFQEIKQLILETIVFTHDWMIEPQPAPRPKNQCGESH